MVVEDPHDPPVFGDDLVLMLSDMSLDKQGQLLAKDNGGGLPSWNAKPLHARLGETQVWTLTNNSVFDHPFHLHGYSFQVLDDERIPEWRTQSTCRSSPGSASP